MNDAAAWGEMVLDGGAWVVFAQPKAHGIAKYLAAVAEKAAWKINRAPVLDLLNDGEQHERFDGGDVHLPEYFGFAVGESDGRREDVVFQEADDARGVDGVQFPALVVPGVPLAGYFLEAVIGLRLGQQLCFAARLAAEGSIPASICRLASSRPARASARLMRGKLPSASFFCTPSKR